MNKRDMKKFEALLMAELAHLSEGIRKIEESTLYETSFENKGDLSSYAEVGTDNFERETALNIASGESEWLQNVKDALHRIEDRTYGKCEGCKDEIPRKRLEAFPSARYCIACQSEFEKNGVLQS